MAGSHLTHYVMFGKVVPSQYVVLGIFGTYFGIFKAYQWSRPAKIEAPNDPIKNISASQEEEKFIREFMKELETAE